MKVELLEMRLESSGTQHPVVPSTVTSTVQDYPSQLCADYPVDLLKSTIMC